MDPESQEFTVNEQSHNRTQVALDQLDALTSNEPILAETIINSAPHFKRKLVDPRTERKKLANMPV